MRTTIAMLASTIALASPALAQPGYRASLAQPAPSARVVARETLWSCAGQECRASRSGHMSDVAECRQVARKLGTVAAFQSGDRAFTPAEIGRCNDAVETAAAR